MFSLTRSLQMGLAVLALPLFMGIPAIADAPYTGASSKPVAPVSHAAKVGTAPQGVYVAKPVIPTTISTNAPCPPCEFCGMYPVNPHGPKVAAPQLQTTAPSSSYMPSYIQKGQTAAAPVPAHVPAQAHVAAPSAPPMGTYAVGGYVSNMPLPPGPNPSIGEVWQRSGGARLQYDALRGPIQMYTNGMPVKDPALVHLPPLYPTSQPRATTHRPPVRPKATVSAPVAPKQHTGNASHKPSPQAPQQARPTMHDKDAKPVHNTMQPQIQPAPKPALNQATKPSLNQAAKPQSLPTGQTALPNRHPEIQASSEPISRPYTPPMESPYEGPAGSVGSIN